MTVCTQSLCLVTYGMAAAVALATLCDFLRSFVKAKDAIYDIYHTRMNQTMVKVKVLGDDDATSDSRLLHHSLQTGPTARAH